jgi:hypothetical protein
MRAVTVVVRSAGEAFHPVGERLRAAGHARGDPID